MARMLWFSMTQATVHSSFRARLCAVFALLAMFAGPVQAHQDRLLPVQADGAIPDIPPQFGKATLTVEGLGSDRPLVRLTIGANQTTLPLCAARLIRSRSPGDIKVTGSWYHDLRPGGLPYYLSMTFFDPGYDPKRKFNSSRSFLFNLNDAKLIRVKRFEAAPSDDGGQFGKADLPPDCMLNSDS